MYGHWTTAVACSGRLISIGNTCAVKGFTIALHTERAILSLLIQKLLAEIWGHTSTEREWVRTISSSQCDLSYWLFFSYSYS